MATTSTATDYSKLTTPTASTTTQVGAAVKQGVDGALSQTQFLKLLTTQMTHQDPSQPMTNGDFLAQMAQFGTVSGIQDLQKSFSDFANTISSGQALQAAGLVGHTVLIPSSQSMLETGKSLDGEVTLTGSTPNLTLKVVNAKTGEEVNSLPLGSQSKGTVPFSWDGTNAAGELADPGSYKISATAMIDGKETEMETQLQAEVKSVTLGSGGTGLTVNLADGDSVNFNDVKQIL